VSTKLNLASKPFSNRSLPWVISFVIVFASLLSLVFIVQATRRSQTQLAAVQTEINAMGQEEQQLRQKAEAVKNSLTTEQLQALTAAHTLVGRKRFSWSRLLADLESSLPGDARVKRIAVRGIANQNGQTLADLELAVIAKSPSVITQMIADMDREGTFQAELRSQNLQRGRGETGAEYELFIVYRPRAGAPTNSASFASAETRRGDVARVEKQ